MVKLLPKCMSQRYSSRSNLSSSVDRTLSSSEKKTLRNDASSKPIVRCRFQKYFIVLFCCKKLCAKTARISSTERKCRVNNIILNILYLTLLNLISILKKYIYIQISVYSMYKCTYLYIYIYMYICILYIYRYTPMPHMHNLCSMPVNCQH